MTYARKHSVDLIPLAHQTIPLKFDERNVIDRSCIEAIFRSLSVDDAEDLVANLFDQLDSRLSEITRALHRSDFELIAHLSREAGKRASDLGLVTVSEVSHMLRDRSMARCKLATPPLCSRLRRLVNRAPSDLWHEKQHY